MSGESSSGGSARHACVLAVPEVLETMFFEVLADLPGVGTLPEFGSLDTSRVDFEGSACGHVVVAATSQQTALFAKAFLALDEQAAAAAAGALVLGELANIVCGNVLGRFQPDGSFRLSTPVTQLGRPVAGINEPGFTWLRFPLDSGPLLVGVTLEVAE
jgi:CheY-specific phosphatase CheX